MRFMVWRQSGRHSLTRNNTTSILRSIDERLTNPLHCRCVSWFVVRAADIHRPASIRPRFCSSLFGVRTATFID